jgi:hypothetical protein
MGATLATLDAITKEVYEEPLREQLNNDTPLLSRVEKTSRGTSNEVGGRYVTFPIHTKRNSGIGARAEMGQLPTPGQQGTAAARVSLAYLYGGVQLTGQAISLIDKNYQAFASAMELELNGLRTDLKVDLNRQVWGDGKGTIGKVTSVVTSTTIPVDRPELFQLDEIVDYCLAAGTVSQAGRTITAIDTVNKTVTVSGANIGPTVVGDFFVRTGNLNNEWIGLTKIIANSGTLYNVDPNTVPVWKSVINTNGGTPTAISEGMLTKMVDDIHAQGGKTTVIATSLGVRRAYANLLQNQRQYVNKTEFTGGFSGLSFVTDSGEIPIFGDYMATPSQASFINEDSLKYYRESDWGFMDMDGSKWQRVIGYDAYQAMMVQYSQLGIDRRNSFGQITNIIEE